jgi:hypothetical protein
MTRFLIVTLLFVSAFTTSASAAVAAPPAAVQETTLTRADLEAELGRKLTFRERLAVKAIARQQKKQARKASRGGRGYGNGMAIAGFVCGILSLLGFGIFLGIPAIIFSAIGLGKANREGRPHRGLAIAGLVCGIISVAATVLLIALFAVAFGA